MLTAERLIGGRYNLEEVFLKCRFSSLHKGLDLVNDAPVMIRELHQAIPGDNPRRRRDARVQILREGRILAGLEHRNLPRVLDVIEDGDRIYLVMEDFNGGTLEKYHKDNQGKPLDYRVLLRWTQQLVSVLSYLHQQEPPIIHRDIHPASVLVSPHGVIKIAEFGLARMNEAGSAPAVTMFRAVGHPAYASPEQLLQSPSSPANDVYSLGALLYHLATGVTPANSLDRLEGRAQQAPTGSLNREIPAGLARLIDRMAEPRVEERIPDMTAAGRELLEAMPADVSTSFSLPMMLQPRIKPASAPDGHPPALSTKTSPKIKSAGVDEGKNIWDSFFSLPDWFGQQKEQASAVEGAPDRSEMDRFAFVDLSTLQLDRMVGELIPEGISRSIQGICIGRPSKNQITVAVKDPTQIYIYDHISYATGGSLKPVLVRAEPVMIDLAREFLYRDDPGARTKTWLEWLQQKKYETDKLDVKTDQEDLEIFRGEIKGPVIEAVDKIIKEAISVGASDIHMENFDTEMVVRYRIDGVLHLIGTYDRKLAGAIVKRIKITAGMDIAQDRVTQGGRISVRVSDREFDLRVSIVPVPFGENVVMRLLNKGSFDYSLSDLGFLSEQETLYRKMLASPHGMILVSGPTGSGKSTTLYASLAEINRPDRKLLTVEDPIEYQMPGITQVQVNMAPRDDSKKVTFSNALREFLRQDPDVILVGEIRDSETAAIAVQAALTGHLLLSTIHTNDAVGIVTRLVDMGVEPFLISSTLVGGVAQRLVRKVCENCRQPMEPTAEMLEKFNQAGIRKYSLFKGSGCVNCHHTGNKGRIGIYEVMQVTGKLRTAIARGGDPGEIARAAAADGMKTLYDDGLVKVARGLITYEELLRVTLSD